MGLTTVQWIAIIGAAAIIVLPRLGIGKTLWVSILKLFGKTTEAPVSDIHVRVDAYCVLEPYLSPELCVKVWDVVRKSPWGPTDATTTP